MKRLMLLFIILIFNYSCTWFGRDDKRSRYMEYSSLIYKNDTNYDIEIEYNISESKIIDNNTIKMYDDKDWINIPKRASYLLRGQTPRDIMNMNIIFANQTILEYKKLTGYERSPLHKDSYEKKIINHHDNETRELKYTYSITPEDYNNAKYFTRNTCYYYNQTPKSTELTFFNYSNSEYYSIYIPPNRASNISFYVYAKNNFIPPPYFNMRDEAIIIFYDNNDDKELKYLSKDTEIKSPLNLKYYTKQSDGTYKYEITQEDYKKAKSIKK